LKDKLAIVTGPDKRDRLNAVSLYAASLPSSADRKDDGLDR
jgi:hypothetical protein